ncbi:MAG TPA: hypothetical protein VFM18_19290 [Methanosarcina sp.]|nr:hypothetical protein [Methanosarcina sp.]
MATPQQLQTQITQAQTALAQYNTVLAGINTILNNGVYSANGQNVTYNGTTHLVSDLLAQRALLEQNITQTNNTIVNLQNQVSLASLSIATPQTGKSSTEALRTYQHAKKIFVDSNYRLSPKYGFIFYVEFDFNPLITNLTTRTAQEMGMIVKSATLPSFAIDTKAHNAYNRKNYVQNGIKYDPITITFHDDQSNNILNFWYDYYSYYYRDPDYADATYSAYHKYQSRPTFDWGYSPRPAIGYNSAAGTQPYQYIQAIRIYTMYQSKFDQYELINPIISSFRHGEVANGSNNNLLQHEMTVQFETVKYLSGYVTPNTVAGFIELQYDRTTSPNGGTPASLTNPDQITDYANKTTTLGPQLNAALVSTAQPSSMSVAEALNNQTQQNSKTATNSGGFLIPALGSFTQGLTNADMIIQNLESAGIALAGTAASSLANGIVGNISSKLGTKGTSIVGLAASALTNPAQTLATVENMATQGALSVALNKASGVISTATTTIEQKAAAVGSDIANSSIGQKVSGGVQQLTNNVNNWFGGP